MTKLAKNILGASEMSHFFSYKALETSFDFQNWSDHHCHGSCLPLGVSIVLMQEKYMKSIR